MLRKHSKYNFVAGCQDGEEVSDYCQSRRSKGQINSQSRTVTIVRDTEFRCRSANSRLFASDQTSQSLSSSYSGLESETKEAAGNTSVYCTKSYDKDKYCTYCLKVIKSKMARHLLQAHADKR
jgi:hypothetical protein